MSENRQLTVKSLLSQDGYKQRFSEILKERTPQFIASITSQCAAGALANVNPNSVIAAAFTAATLNLPIDKNLGFSWIIGYKGVAQFQMGYKGYIQLALRTSQYSRLNAFGVNTEALGGFDDVGEPIIDFEKLDETLEPVGYAVIWKLVNGFRKCVYWSKAKVEKHARRYSHSFGKGASSPWTSNFDEMALKTVISNGLKRWGILSTELQRAFQHDQNAQMEVDSEIIYSDNEQPKLDNPTVEDLVGAKIENLESVEQSVDSPRNAEKAGDEPTTSLGSHEGSTPSALTDPDLKTSLVKKIEKRVADEGLQLRYFISAVASLPNMSTTLKLLSELNAETLDSLDEQLDELIEKAKGIQERREKK